MVNVVILGFLAILAIASEWWLQRRKSSKTAR